MIFAAIGGIHGNLPALLAVLDQIDDEGIQTIVNTGDCAIGHPWPNEVINLLRARNLPSVQGEEDRRLVRAHRKEHAFRAHFSADDYAQLERTFAACDSANIEWLRGLPRTLVLTVDGIEIALCHGTLNSQSQSLGANDPPERFRRQREITSARMIVCGRSAAPFARAIDGALFVNPGCVGGANAAQYAVVSTEEEPWRAELRTVDAPISPT